MLRVEERGKSRRTRPDMQSVFSAIKCKASITFLYLRFFLKAGTPSPRPEQAVRITWNGGNREVDLLQFSNARNGGRSYLSSNLGAGRSKPAKTTRSIGSRYLMLFVFGKRLAPRREMDSTFYH